MYLQLVFKCLPSSKIIFILQDTMESESDKQVRRIPPYKLLILNTLYQLGKDNRSYFSKIIISKYINANWPVGPRFASSFNDNLRSLEDEELIVRKGQSFRIPAKVRNKVNINRQAYYLIYSL